MSGPFKMKNSALRMSAKSGSPMQENYASPVKAMPSYIDNKLVSDSDADLQEEKNEMINTGKIKGETKEVTRKGPSARKKILKDVKKKGGPNAKPDAIDNLMLKQADEYTSNPENRDELTKAWYLNNPGYKLVDGKKVKK